MAGHSGAFEQESPGTQLAPPVLKSGVRAPGVPVKSLPGALD